MYISMYLASKATWFCPRQPGVTGLVWDQALHSDDWFCLAFSLIE